MSKIALNSNASGTGVFTIASPNSDTDRTLTLPDESGTILTSASEVGVAGIDSSATGTAITIDSSDRVLMPSQPVISGQIGTAATDPASPVLLPFNEFWCSVGITYNSSTRRFTVPVAGKYRITLNPFYITGVFNARLLVGVNTDAPANTTHYGHDYRGNTDYQSGCINSVVSLAANDYIVFYLSSGTIYNRSNDKFNQFSIQLIG